jgi:hypothetical protein
MEKYCDDEKINLKIFLDLHAFKPPDSEKVVFG